MPEMPLITVDIISDVVCPWCIIGYKKLEQAMQRFDGRASFALRWLPFELNPQMPPEGEDVAEHMARKYGASAGQAKAGRDRMRAAGEAVGFTFTQNPQMRIVNTFDAHRLVHWAGTLGDQNAIVMRLFEAHFTDGEDVSDHRVLIEAAKSAGLDGEEARRVLETDAFARNVRNFEAEWEDRFITGVPAYIMGGKFMIPGAQDANVFAQIIEDKILAKAA